MKILYYDCFCGISGDMNLGAMLDLGVDEDYLTAELSKLGLDHEFGIRVHKESKNGITGTKADVILKDPAGEDGHPHRRLADIREIIHRSGLKESVIKSAMDIFNKMAEAEEAVHGGSADEVHFHGAGAVDSIVDVVGAAIALDFLGVDRIMASSIQVGGGFVTCAHGVLPVPAPVVARILQGAPLRFGAVPFETTTPAGAAILAVHTAQYTDRPEFTIEKTGYGIGVRDFEIPNVLRVFLGTIGPEQGSRAGSGLDISRDQSIIETNIDDMNPEIYSYVEERLLEAGALDVYKTPIIMKKGRPSVKLSILADAATQQGILDVIFTETTSIGVRRFAVEKIMLPRTFSTIKTRYGEVSIKNAFYRGDFVKYKAEYGDCRRLAKENGVPVTEIYREIESEMAKTGKHPHVDQKRLSSIRSQIDKD